MDEARILRFVALPLLVAVVSSTGCQMQRNRVNYNNVCAGGACEPAVSNHLPRELKKVSLPEYRIEPPDILLIEAVNNLRPANAPLVPGNSGSSRSSVRSFVLIYPKFVLIYPKRAHLVSWSA